VVHPERGPPVDAPSAAEAAPPPGVCVIPPGVVPPGCEEVRLPGTRAVVDLVNRHTPHLPYLWLPDPSAYGGYAQHDRSCALAPDWGRDPRTRFARWFRAYRWDAR